MGRIWWCHLRYFCSRRPLNLHVCELQNIAQTHDLFYLFSTPISEGFFRVESALPGTANLLQKQVLYYAFPYNNATALIGMQASKASSDAFTVMLALNLSSHAKFSVGSLLVQYDIILSHWFMRLLREVQHYCISLCLRALSPMINEGIVQLHPKSVSRVACSHNLDYYCTSVKEHNPSSVDLQYFHHWSRKYGLQW